MPILQGRLTSKENLIYPQCQFVVKPVSKSDRQQIVISKICEEYEEDEDIDEQVFLVDISLRLSFDSLNKKFLFQNDNEMFEFQSNENNVTEMEKVYLAVIRCCFTSAMNGKPQDVPSQLVWYENAINSELVHIEEQDMAGKVVYETGLVGFFYYDGHEQIFKLQDPAVNCYLVKTGEHEYSFVVKSSFKQYLSQKIDVSMNITADKKNISCIWNYQDEKKDTWSLSVQLKTLKELDDLIKILSNSLFETLNKESVKNEEDYFAKGFDGDSFMKEENDDDEKETEEEEEGESEEEEEEEQTSSSGIANTIMSTGYQSGRTFVVRGNSVGVFKHTDDDRLQFQTQIKNISDTKGNTFTPTRAMLHHQDSSLLLLNPDNPTSVYEMNLERGQVIDEWKMEDVRVNEIIPQSKYAQMTPAKTLIGINENSLFRIDPRQKEKVVDAKTYSSKTDFRCAVTTDNEFVAVASGKGEVRLYDKLSIRAKTNLPGFGDPIKGIDTSRDGKFVLATCENYLLLSDVQAPNGESTGFSTRLGANKKPPIRLRLKPEHATFIGNVSFTPAKFNVGDNDGKFIVTSTGPYVITWNLKDVNRGKLFDYQIKHYSDTVVADSFRFNHDKTLIVALPHNVTIAKKGSFQTPEKLKRNEVVNSPF